MDELSIYRQWFEHITEKNEIVIMWSEIVIIFSCLLDGSKSVFLFSLLKSCTCLHQAVNRLWLVHCTNTQYHSQKPYMVRIKMWSLFALYILTLHSSRMSFWTIFHSYALHNAICIVWDHYSIMYVCMESIWPRHRTSGHSILPSRRAIFAIFSQSDKYGEQVLASSPNLTLPVMRKIPRPFLTWHFFGTTILPYCCWMSVLVRKCSAPNFRTTRVTLNSTSDFSSSSLFLTRPISPMKTKSLVQ